MQEQLENQEEMQIDLLEIVHVLMRKLWIIILCAVAGAVAMGSYTKFLITPLYSTSATIYVVSNTANVSGVTLNLSLSEQLTADFMVLAKSRPVIEQVITELDLGTSYEGLVGSVSVENPSGSHMLKVTAVNSNPELAKDIANKMAEVVARQISTVMDVDEPNLMESAVTPKGPSSPNMTKNIFLGGLIGAALAVGIILLLYMLDDTVKNEDDVKRYLGVNTLAAFPEIRKKRRKSVA